MIQNLKNETAWHLRGLRRVGVSFEDVEKVQQCVSLEFFDFFPENEGGGRGLCIGV